MKLDNTITQTTSGLFTPVAIGFIQNSIQMMIPWLIVMFVVILTDLISGIRKSIKLGVEVSPSTAFRETMGKMVTYFSWVIMVCLLDVAMGGETTAAKLGCLLVIAIEGGSIVSNILKPYGVEISLKGILRVIFMRSPLNASQEEAEQVIRDKKIEQIRKKEHEKWNHKSKKDMVLKKGSRGDEVRALQQALHLYVDGIFGILTEEAVKEYQKAHGLVADGIVGDKTWAKLFPSGKTSVTLQKSKRVINEIIIHCTATPEGQDMTVEQITASHKKRGFTTIGYHYVIYRDGSIHKGRDVNVSGAHCTNHNTHSIGVSYVGGLENIKGVAYNKLPIKDTRTAKQKAALLKLLKDLKVLYPKAKIIGHRDTSPDKNGNGIIEPFEWIKGCPCFDAKTEYKNI